MGVMHCSRRGCDNIVCERYSKENGYICNECFEELINRGPEINTEDFMASSKMHKNLEAAKARFEIEFPIIDV